MNQTHERVLIISCGAMIGMALFALAPTAHDTVAVFPDDFDGDGILDEFDNCVTTWNGLPDAPVPPPPHYFIRCGPQEDTDQDGYGDPCDFDFNNDGATGIDDCTVILSAAFEAQVGTEADLNCDGAVGLDDVTTAFGHISVTPGPSGLDCSAANSKGSCPPIVSW